MFQEMMVAGSGGGGGVTRETIATGQSSLNSYTHNIATLLPNVYKNLTLDNFAISAKENYTSGTGQTLNKIPTSYDAQTGVLTCAQSYSYSSAGGYKFYFQYDLYCYY